MKKCIALIVLLFLPFSSIITEAKGGEVYIALGDSIAAGQTPNRAIDAGYTDLIAQELTRSHQLAYFSKALAFPGYTTADVLKTVRTKEAKELLKNATVVTISAGANDLLRLVQVNPSKGTVAYKQVQVDYALNNVRKNIDDIIQEVQAITPKAKIVVMGYYFAYPHVHDAQKEGIKKELNTMNTILKTEANANGATFVDVEEAFKGHEKELLPNSSDVHPTMEGYRLMANAFLKQYNERLQVNKNELPAPNPLTFEQILEKQKESVKKPVSRIQGFDQYLSLTKLKPYI
ncbi:SGNH/GDSL hydrolase family protein [Psychrobacillus glaciei]|uniref:SGNH/GDSL hydrolase family protein n=1 Tax=Psychrobacillus glaciei TaxID=2283160 RepID=A0A5J6SQL6_9BACI|nr:SGNH/GDSL hydrolase family protein [Psychrobacillus glaciei]QFG00221.1 SGNH/GDSL hydrolase family protein [Psychrobacillus glaciei]